MALLGSMKDPAATLPGTGFALEGATLIDGKELHAIYFNATSGVRIRRVFHQDGSVTTPPPEPNEAELMLSLKDGIDHIEAAYVVTGSGLAGLDIGTLFEPFQDANPAWYPDRVAYSVDATHGTGAQWAVIQELVGDDGMVIQFVDDKETDPAGTGPLFSIENGLDPTTTYSDGGSTIATIDDAPHTGGAFDFVCYGRAGASLPIPLHTRFEAERALTTTIGEPSHASVGRVSLLPNCGAGADKYAILGRNTGGDVVQLYLVDDPDADIDGLETDFGVSPIPGSPFYADNYTDGSGSSFQIGEV